MGFKDAIMWFEKAKSEATDLDFAGHDPPVRFCGVDIYRDSHANFHATQSAYVKEVVKRHGLEGKRQNVPIQGFDEPEEETDRTAADLRAAQQIAGVFQWVSTKTKPDIPYAVSRVGRATVGSPKLVVGAGRGVL